MTTLPRPTFTVLLREAVAHCRMAWEPLLAGVLFFGLFSAGLQLYMIQEHEKHIERVIVEMGVNTQRLEELSTGAQVGDPNAVRAIVNELAAPARMLSDMSPEERQAFRFRVHHEVMKTFFPTLSVLLFLFYLLITLSVTYVSVQAITGEEDPRKLAGKTLRFFPRIALLPIVVLLRTVIGLIFILGMLYIPSMVIAIKEDVSAWRAASLSYHRSKKDWLLLLSAVAWITLLLATFIWGIHQFYVPLSSGSLLGAFFVKAFLQQVVLVLGVVMSVRLGFRYL